MSNKLPYTKEGKLHNHNALSKQTKAKIKKKTNTTKKKKYLEIGLGKEMKYMAPMRVL